MPRGIKKPTLKSILIFAGIIIALLALRLIFNTILENPAKKELSPIAANLKRNHAKFICDNGDAGLGLDNSAPWYQVSYYLNDKDAVQNLDTAAALAGYGLSADTKTQQQMKDVPVYQNNLYFLASKGEHKLTVTLAKPGGKIDLYCADTKHYYDVASANASTDAVQFKLYLPSRH